MTKDVLIFGASQGGIQAAMDLADAGVKVHLVETSPFIGEFESPAYPEYLKNVQLLEILKHPNITTWTNTAINEINPQKDYYQVVLDRYPRYIDLSKCTACGDCVDICPVTVPGTNRKAIYLGGEPNCAAIEKAGIPPCTNACPAGVHVQGYVALIAQERYLEAYQLIHDALPFPSVCGRVCNHLCEQACSRSQLDEPVNIMALKRVVADWAFEHQEELSTPKKPDSSKLQEGEGVQFPGKDVAIIGAGPAGLTAARDLIRYGHRVSVYDANSVPGGMMRVGIPPHRVSYEQLSWEIEQIIKEGVDLHLNTWVDDIAGLLSNGFEVVLIASGVSQDIKPSIMGADHPDNWHSLDFLKRVSFGEEIDLSGRQVIVLGGGDVAMDAARAALRLGNPKVQIVCRGLRASAHELQQTEEEGIEIIRGRVFLEIVVEGKVITGVSCLEAEVGEVVNQKRQFKEIPGTEHIIPGDLVIWAIGQKSDQSFLPPNDQIATLSGGGIATDECMMTSMEGVFVAGDYRQGMTSFVVDAVGEGHQVAKYINSYLKGESGIKPQITRSEVILDQEEMVTRVEERKSAQKKRKPIRSISLSERENNFCEVDLSIGEKAALQEAGRCLICGPCSECMACVEVCKPGAVILNQQGLTTVLDIRQILDADHSSQDPIAPNLYRIPADEATMGSAVAYQVMVDLGIKPRLAPAQHQPIMVHPSASNRIGLILCQCGGEISNIVDTTTIQKEASNWSELVYVQEFPFACSEKAAEDLMDIIHTHSLDKFILAACSCCSLDQICYSCTYQRLRCKENLGVFSSLKSMAQAEFINIREHCAWAHAEDRDAATAAASTLIKSTLARLESFSEELIQDSRAPKRVFVIGNNPAGQFCYDSLQQLGVIVEKLDSTPKHMERIGGKTIIRENGSNKGADLIVLAPNDKKELKKMLSKYKFFNGRPVIYQDNPHHNTLDMGFIVCSPTYDQIVSGKAAAAKIIAWINRQSIRSTLVARVERYRCRACSTCVEVCGFGIPVIIEDDLGNYSYIDPQLCLGCGICTAHCPSGAIRPGETTDYQLEAMLDFILG